MSSSDRSHLLGPLLKSVSRSFYLTLRILPAGMRDPVALGYLLARAADTIADTALIAPEKRLEFLMSLREQVNGRPDPASLGRIAAEVASRQKDSDEKVLLESLGRALALINELSESDRKAVREIVTTLTTGMEFDLHTFPNESSGEIGALREYADLDRYTYLVAGCVGEFWTRMTRAHVSERFDEPVEMMVERGIRFGKALQLTNVLRDCGKDLRIGRCYLPQPMLEAAGLTPRDLLSPDASLRARGVRDELLGRTLEHYREAVAYTVALPSMAVRLRLACVWPILIGLETLLLLARNDRWLEPGCASKVRRSDVYRIMVRSVPMVLSNAMLRRSCDDLMARIATR